MLPVMQSDIMLQRDDRVLIIDAKYYEHSMQVQFNKHTLHSANLYQIFTYVKNKEYELREKEHTVSIQTRIFPPKYAILQRKKGRLPNGFL